VTLEVGLGDHHFALEQALGEKADKTQPDRVATLVLDDEILAESRMEDPEHRVVVAERWDDAFLQRLVEQLPRVGSRHAGLLEAETTARHHLGWSAENARSFGLVEVETTDVLTGQQAEGYDLAAVERCGHGLGLIREIAVDRHVGLGRQGEAAGARAGVGDVDLAVQTVRGDDDDDETGAGHERDAEQAASPTASAVAGRHQRGATPAEAVGASRAAATVMGEGRDSGAEQGGADPEGETGGSTGLDAQSGDCEGAGDRQGADAEGEGPP
jgi:hypothetical protein